MSSDHLETRVSVKSVHKTSFATSAVPYGVMSCALTAGGLASCRCGLVMAWCLACNHFQLALCFVTCTSGARLKAEQEVHHEDMDKAHWALARFFLPRCAGGGARLTLPAGAAVLACTKCARWAVNKAKPAE